MSTPTKNLNINAVDISTFFHLTTASASAVPTLVTLHNERLHDRPTEQTIGSDRLLGVALRSADWVTCVSASVLAQVRQVAPEVIAKSSIIYNGLEPPHVLPQPLPTDAPRLLCLGRLITRKGFDLALTAFASIGNRYPHVSLTIAGDGPARAALEQQAAQLGVSGRVEFAGSVAPEDVPALVNASTIVVMPSRHEPFGLVALDAALMARPIVASRVGGLPEVIKHKQTGLLVDKEDCKGLAEAMAFFLDHPEQAKCMGRAARRRALDTFSWESCVSGYANLYRSLIVSAQAKTG